MVSFQCHGCGDVVKKPKLDQHSSRCYSSFDCIDCSKTFKIPAEYKGHTSCISEAEKYQKGLYKGPKTSANGLKISNSHQHNSLLDKKDTTNTPVSRQSNAQWDRNPQPTSFDNVNGYPDPQHQQPQNGWQNGRDNYRYADRGRKSSNWHQNKFSRSSASGANDTPLGISRRSSVGDPVVVNEGDALVSGAGNRANGASQQFSQAEETEVKKKRKPKDDDCPSQTGKEKPTEPDTAKAKKDSAVVNNDEERKAKRRKKKDEAGPETGTAEPGPDIKEKVRKETSRREKQIDAEQSLADAHSADSENNEKTKKGKRRNEAIDEPYSIRESGAGSEDKRKGKKEKKRKEKKLDNDDKSETRVPEDIKIPASVEEQTTKAKKRKKKATTDESAADPDTPVVDSENTAAGDIVSAPVLDQTTKKKKKSATMDSIAEMVAHVGKEETQKKKEVKREREVVQGETRVNLKDKKRKRHEEPNGSTEKKRIKH